MWYNQWKNEWVEGPICWKTFKVVFLDSFFPLELREVNMIRVYQAHQAKDV